MDWMYTNTEIKSLIKNTIKDILIKNDRDISKAIKEWIIRDLQNSNFFDLFDGREEIDYNKILKDIIINMKKNKKVK